MSGSRLAVLLRNELLGQKNDFLLFRVLRVDAVCEFPVEGAEFATVMLTVSVMLIHSEA